MKEQSYLSEAIRAARRRAGLSQAELAELLGVRQSSVSQWERGSTKPSTVHLLALASTLQCSLLDFSGARPVADGAMDGPAGRRPVADGAIGGPGGAVAGSNGATGAEGLQPAARATEPVP